MIDGYQDYIDIKRSSAETMIYKQDFRPDVVVANIREHNYTRGNKLVIMEPDFSAQTEAQSCKRQHRFEQSRDCRVYRLICPNVS